MKTFVDTGVIIIKRYWFFLMIVVFVWPGDGDLFAQGGAGGDFPRTVIDGTGAAVSIPARPEIVAVMGHDPVLAALLPPARIRQIDPADEDWAGVGLLVIGAGQAAAYPALIAAADVPVYRTALISSLDGWRSAVEQLGQATGSEKRADGLITRLDHRLAAIRGRVGGDSPVRVLILTPEGYTFGQGTLITDLITAAGGINVAAEAGYADFRQIGDETIRVLAPDVILLSPAWRDAGPFVTNPAYADVPAVRAGRVIRLPFSPTAPGDPAAAVLALAVVLHPAAVCP